MQELLERLRNHIQRAPVNVEAAIRDFGITYLRDGNLAQGISGYLKRRDNGRYEIVTAAGEPLTRQRFTAAHELGHYVLHRSLVGDGVDDDTQYRSTEVGDIYNTAIKQVHERQANSFAAQILMPKRLVLEQVDALVRLSDFARHFDVSPTAMRWRLKNLNVLDRVEDDCPN